MSIAIKLYDSYDGNKVRKDEESGEDVRMLCFDLNSYSKTKQFLLCCSAVFVFYITYGYLQELLFSSQGLKSCGWYLTLIQFGFYTLFGVLELYFKGVLHERRIPLKTCLLLAFLTLGTMGFSNSSLAYLNYPTEVIFKCCKLIPVMIGSIVIQKKSYNKIDFLAAGLMCLGLTLFTLADSMVSPNFNFTGIAMISCALLCDAVIGNVQEMSLKKYKASNTEMVLYSYAVGFVYLLMIMLGSGQLQENVRTCSTSPMHTYGYAFLFSASGYLGIQVVLTLVRTSGALIAATVTTCRKAVTIIISFIFFAKPFTLQYFWSGMLVVLAIYLNVLSKNKSQREWLLQTLQRKVLHKPRLSIQV